MGKIAILTTALLLVINNFLLAGDKSFDEVVKIVELGDSNELRRVIQADPQLVNLTNSNGLPLIHKVVMIGKSNMVLILIEAGAKIDAVDRLGRKPLHIAAGWSNFEMVELLLSKGADPKSKTIKGDTSLDFANNNYYEGKNVEREKIKELLSIKGSVVSEGEQERRKAIKEVEEIIASRPDKGPEPKQSLLDGSVEIIREYVRDLTKDPSPRFEEWSKVSSLGDKWAVRAKFTYKNSVGVSRQDNLWFYIVGSKVVSIKTAQ
jgi:hypothetical protein